MSLEHFSSALVSLWTLAPIPSCVTPFLVLFCSLPVCFGSIPVACVGFVVPHHPSGWFYCSHGTCLKINCNYCCDNESFGPLCWKFTNEIERKIKAILYSTNTKLVSLSKTRVQSKFLSLALLLETTSLLYWC